MSLFHTLLAKHPVLLADGATGTNLFAMGLMSGDAPELWNIAHPERIEALHQSFVDVGSDIILTNSFGGTRYRLALHKAGQRVAEINLAAARIARRIAERAPRPVLVAGSIGPTGELFEPLGPLTPDSGAQAFAEQAAALAAGGVDILWLETLSSREELEAAVAGVAATGLPTVATLSFDTNGSTMMGLTPAALADLCAQMPQPPAAFGTNCGVGPAEVVAAIADIARIDVDRILVAKANCGVPEFRDGQIRYSGTPELMARYACLARDAGARIIGGCCGTTPEHIRRMRAALIATAPRQRPELAAIEAELGDVSEATRARASGAVPAASRRGRAASVDARIGCRHRP